MPEEIRLISRKQRQPKSEPIETDEAGVPVAPSFLGHTMAAVHTLGSLLSAPSRAVWGGINAATGGEGGTGNLNPFDSTGGIELSHVLANKGLIAKNDDSRWELMPTVENGKFNPGDIGRGVIDMVGDPTTWLTPLGLTKAGSGLAKAGALEKGLINQIAAKQRALVSARVPFGGVIGELGTGTDVADALTQAGRAVADNSVVKKVVGSGPVQATAGAIGKGYRAVRGLMRAPYHGVTDERVAKFMPGYDESLAEGRFAINEKQNRIGRNVQDMTENTPAGSMTPMQRVRQSLEQSDPAFRHEFDAADPAFGVDGLDRHAAELKKDFEGLLAKKMEYGVGSKGHLRDRVMKNEKVVVTDPLTGKVTVTFVPDEASAKEIGYFTRHKAAVAGDTTGTKGSIGASDRRRKELLKGFYHGTDHPEFGVDAALKDFAEAAKRLAPAGPVSATRAGRKAWKDAVVEHIENSDKSEYINPTYTRKVKNKLTGVGEDKEVSRFRDLAEYVMDNPELAEKRLFAGDPLADAMKYHHMSNTQIKNAELVQDVFADKGNLNYAGPNKSVSLGKALKGLGYVPDKAARKIAEKAGVVVDTPEKLNEFLLGRVDRDLVKNMKFATPKAAKQAAEEEVAGAWQQMMNWFKGGILAFPASRVRDVASGYVKNLMNGWGLPGSDAYKETKRIMTGGDVANDYRHLDFVKDWFKKSGKVMDPAANPNFAKDQTEAVRQMIGAHLPREHGMIGDIDAGQHGTQLGDLLQNVPGTKEKSMYQHFIGEPLEAVTQSYPGKYNPLGMRGVAGNTKATFAPVKMSESFSSSGDQLNRTAGFLSQIQKKQIERAAADAGLSMDDFLAKQGKRGAIESVAGKNVNRAQIDYDPHTFSKKEKEIKRSVMPFYSFASRSLPETARQLADFGSPTSQLVKAQSRAYEGNPAVPEYILDSSGVPLGRSEDGTLRYLAGLGLMHEPATKMIGQAVSGDFKGLGANLLSGVNPFMVAPAEQIFGTSLFRQGEPLINLESNTGRLLANLGAITGTRDKEAGPVDYAGRGAVDFLSSMTPVGRVFSTARKLTDVRRGPGKLLTQDEPVDALSAAREVATGILPAVSGLNYTEVSPERQIMMLRRRAEDLARQGGAKQATMVYNTKADMEILRRTDPEKAEKLEQLQTYINSLRLKKKAKSKE